jgi:two-component system chemotaxis response regulator CheB
MNSKRIRVLVVDDSALVRRVVTDSLAPFTDIEIVGTAVDPYIARDKIVQLNPDVVTLDIEMPRMDGISFLKLIMKHRPMPVIIMSSLTQSGSDKAFEALQAGAVDVLGKPSGTYSAHEDGTRLAEKIRAAAASRLRRPPESQAASTSPRTFADAPQNTKAAAVVAKPPKPPVRTSDGSDRYHPRQLILLGASTGGTEALREVLTSMSGDLPGICIVQHIPAYFSKAFADRLNQQCAMEIREAKSGDVVKPGLALVAPGGFHLVIKWATTHYIVELNEGPQVHHQRPAVDIMFDSAERAGAAPYSVAAVLTGMGADGAAGLLRLKNAGSQTIAQNEETCVVFGMPREAIRMGAARLILPLEQIGSRLEHLARTTAAGLTTKVRSAA